MAKTGKEAAREFHINFGKNYNWGDGPSFQFEYLAHLTEFHDAAMVAYAHSEKLAVLREAAGEICHWCKAEAPLVFDSLYDCKLHTSIEGGNYHCHAAAIHQMIEELEREQP